MKKTASIYKLSIILILCHILTASAQNVQPVIEKDLSAYLFVYFASNSQDGEAVRYAVSMDGFNFKALNNNQPVLDSKMISSTGGVRDPHILRGPDGKTFYMTCTDMVSANGWNSNRAMVLLKSNDLVNWTSAVINIQEKYEGQENLLRVWAPQSVYDRQADKIMVYWSMKHGQTNDIIYYAYANNDFTDLEGEPKPLYIPKSGSLCIDGDIIFKDGTYYLFHSTDTPNGSGIKVATTQSLTAGYDKWTELDGFMQQTKESVEGSGVYKLNNSDTYILMYDVYRQGSYQFTKSTDLKNFTVIDEDISKDFHPRHGTVLPITRNELRTLTEKWGMPEGLPEINNNPALEGYYADPEIIYSHKTKKYYLYPTSDGFDGWSGTYFKTFSSEDLIHWKDEGIILDLLKDVTWANRNAWAPCCIEKKVGDTYKYYYYFTAAQKIGVAVADDPAGPFVDSGAALISRAPNGVRGGQEIDPAVFHDPVSGKDYLYWGNGHMVVVELNEDMVSFRPDSVKVITPDGTFREGTSVFYRNGKYYFLWSENDTRDEDYRVRYGMSDSPTGPIEKPENNLVISKDPAQGIYGTGHNTIIKVPDKDQWYIVYHRFNYPNGIKMGSAAGFHREVCIDEMKFNPDGTIIQVKPTHKGVDN